MVESKGKINFLIFCEDLQPVFEGSQTSLNIIKPLIMMSVPFTPTQITFSVCAGLSGFTEADKENTILRFELISPDGEIILQAENALEVPDFNKPGTIVLGLELKNMAILKEGQTVLNAYLNETFAASQTLDVYVENESEGS